MIPRTKYRKALKSICGNSIPIGRYIGTMRAHDCDKNAWRNRKEYEVYVGYILTKEPISGYEYIIPHVFNVKNGKVYEFTRQSTTNIEYFGEPYKGRTLKDIWKAIPSPREIANLAKRM